MLLSRVRVARVMLLLICAVGGISATPRKGGYTTHSGSTTPASGNCVKNLEFCTSGDGEHNCCSGHCNFNKKQCMDDPSAGGTGSSAGYTTSPNDNSGHSTEGSTASSGGYTTPAYDNSGDDCKQDYHDCMENSECCSDKCEYDSVEEKNQCKPRSFSEDTGGYTTPAYDNSGDDCKQDYHDCMENSECCSDKCEYDSVEEKNQCKPRSFSEDTGGYTTPAYDNSGDDCKQDYHDCMENSECCSDKCEYDSVEEKNQCKPRSFSEDTGGYTTPAYDNSGDDCKQDYHDCMENSECCSDKCEYDSVEEKNQCKPRSFSEDTGGYTTPAYDNSGDDCKQDYHDCMENSECCSDKCEYDSVEEKNQCKPRSFSEDTGGYTTPAYDNSGDDCKQDYHDCMENSECCSDKCEYDSVEEKNQCKPRSFSEDTGGYTTPAYDNSGDDCKQDYHDCMENSECCSDKCEYDSVEEKNQCKPRSFSEDTGGYTTSPNDNSGHSTEGSTGRCKGKVDKKQRELDALDGINVEHMRDVFELVDTDKGGTIDCEELTVLLRMRGLSVSKLRVKSMIRNASSTGAEELNFEEFCKLMAGASGSTSELTDTLVKKMSTKAPGEDELEEEDSHAELRAENDRLKALLLEHNIDLTDTAADTTTPKEDNAVQHETVSFTVVEGMESGMEVTIRYGENKEKDFVYVIPEGVSVGTMLKVPLPLEEAGPPAPEANFVPLLPPENSAAGLNMVEVTVTEEMKPGTKAKIKYGPNKEKSVEIEIPEDAVVGSVLQIPLPSPESASSSPSTVEVTVTEEMKPGTKAKIKYGPNKEKSVEFEIPEDAVVGSVLQIPLPSPESASSSPSTVEVTVTEEMKPGTKAKIKYGPNKEKSVEFEIPEDAVVGSVLQIPLPRRRKNQFL